MFRVFKEKEEDQQPEKATPHSMSPENMKAIFNNLTSGAGRRNQLHQGECKISEAKYSNACHRLG